MLVKDVKTIDDIPENIRLGREYTEEDVISKIDKYGYAYYSINTTWWTVRSENLFKLGSDVPCDMSGSVLFQSDAKIFIKTAKENSDRYGKHGFRAFLAAYHHCVEELMNELVYYPICIRSWDTINLLIDKKELLNKTQKVD